GGQDADRQTQDPGPGWQPDHAQPRNASVLGRLMLRRISHLGLAVKDLDEAIKLYEEGFGLQIAHRWVAEADRMEAGTFRSGATEIELMQPLEGDWPIDRIITKRGE